MPDDKDDATMDDFGPDDGALTDEEEEALSSQFDGQKL